MTPILASFELCQNYPMERRIPKTVILELLNVVELWQKSYNIVLELVRTL